MACVLVYTYVKITNIIHNVFGIICNNFFYIYEYSNTFIKYVKLKHCQHAICVY